MNLNVFLRNMLKRITGKKNYVFEIDPNIQKIYIDSLGKPKDHIERSFFQYKAQIYFNNIFTNIILTLGSFFIAPLYIIKCLLSKKIKQIEKKDAIFYRDGKPENILQNSLKIKYRKLEYNPEENNYLSIEDLKFIFKIIKRYPLSWYFIFKIIIKVSKYSYGIKRYSPKAIIVCSEYSFTSSVLTEYVNNFNIVHIDVMHGEKLFYIRDSFFKFNECYVWDRSYINIFRDLNCETNQFIIEIPNSLKFDVPANIEKKYDMTYYLAAEKRDELIKISNILKEFRNKNYKVSIRPHPRYSNIDLINELFDGFNIEDYNTISIESSLLRTKNAISLYSTVLNQAYYNGIKVVIDDITNKDYYKKLHKLRLSILEREHILLSEII